MTRDGRSAAPRAGTADRRDQNLATALTLLRSSKVRPMIHETGDRPTMELHMRLATLAPVLLALSGLAACNASAPYPNGSPFVGANVSANPYRQGTPEFCRRYARQTAANSYENRIDRGEDGFGVRALTRQSAARNGNRAYRRCLSRR